MSQEGKPPNSEIAAVLDQIADLLEAQGANIHRIRAYRDGADSVRSANQPVSNYVRDDDRAGLKALPGIGEGLSNVIFEYVEAGRSGVLERLQAEVEPEQVLAQVPGIGDELARRIVNELDVKTLAELERAAHDGRLDKVEGFGERRLEQVRTSLAGMLSGAARRHAARVAGQEERADQPDIETLLAVDEEYRSKAEAGQLPTITPRRFNPENKAWLPILRTTRGVWKFTALFSNTALAHELERTHDWVVIYFDKGDGEDQVTVVTDTSGPLEGKRVVRGRETETLRFYQDQGTL